jgi:hypothetical protein
MTEASVDLKETYYKAKRDLLRTLVEEYPGKSERGPMTEASVDIGYLQLSCTTCTVYMRRRIHVICTVYMRRRHLSQSLIRSLYSAIRPLYSVSRSLCSTYQVHALARAAKGIYPQFLCLREHLRRRIHACHMRRRIQRYLSPVPLPSRTSEDMRTRVKRDLSEGKRDLLRSKRDRKPM